MILHTEQKIQWHNFDQTLHSQTTPLVSPSRASFGVPFRGIFKEMWPQYIDSAMYVHSTIRTLLCVDMSQLITVSVNVSLKFQEMIEPHTPIFALLFVTFFWLSAGWVLRLPWWPPAECFNVMWMLIFTKRFSIPVSLLCSVRKKTYTILIVSRRL